MWSFSFFPSSISSLPSSLSLLPCCVMTVDLMTRTATKRAGSIYSMGMPDKGMIHIQGGIERDSKRFHHATQNRSQLKTYELFLKISV